MIYQKICAHCGRSFQSKSKLAKYCSSSCRASSFKEKTRADARAEEAAAQEAEDKRWKQKAAARTRKRWREVEARASDGDPMAIMETTNKTDPRYWDAWAMYEIRYAEQIGRTSSAKLNGISVYADHFGDEAVRSIKDSGIITTGR